MARNKFVRIDYDGMGFSINYADGAYRRVDNNLFPEEVQDRATSLGFKNSIVDAASGSETLAEFKATVEARIETLMAGSWTKREPAGMSEEQFVEIVMRALPTGNVAKVRQYATKIKPAERKKFVMSRPDTMKAYADIVAERNHKDTDADLGELFED